MGYYYDEEKDIFYESREHYDKTRAGQVKVSPSKPARIRVIRPDSSSRAEVRAAPIKQGTPPASEPIAPKSEVRLQKQSRISPAAVKRTVENLSAKPEIQSAKTSFDYFRLREVFSTYWFDYLIDRFGDKLGLRIVYKVLIAWGVQPVYAEGLDWGDVETATRERTQTELSSLGILSEAFPKKVSETSRGLYDYRSEISKDSEGKDIQGKDYDLPLLTAFSDQKNLTYVLLVSANDAQFKQLQDQIKDYALKRYGSYPENFKIEMVREENRIIRDLTELRNKYDVIGLVSSRKEILPEMNSHKGIVMAEGSPESSAQSIIASLLNKYLVETPKKEIDTKIHTGLELSQGILQELVAALENREQILAAA